MSSSCFDAAVFGAGPAGLCAALQCAREGLHTVLIEKTGLPGGAITLASVAYPGLFHGQAAGALCVLSLRTGRDGLSVPVPMLHDLLRKHGSIIPG